MQRRLRLEQPRGSYLWKLPEMAAFLQEVGASRLFTWMGRWGHPMPKPTEIYSNLPGFHLWSLKRTWSKRILGMIRKEAAAANYKSRWLRKLLKVQPLAFKTAKRFWEARKAILKEQVYFVRKWNPVTERMDITGGKHLADSAAYTRCFCRAVMAAWFCAPRPTWELLYTSIWDATRFKFRRRTIRVRNVEEDRVYLSTPTCFSLIPKPYKP